MATAAQWVPKDIGRGLYSSPSNTARYATKPLPALPLDRASGVSSFSTELKTAFTPPGIPDHNGPFVFEWEETFDKSLRLDQKPEPQDLAPMELKQQQHSMSAPIITAAIRRVGPRSAGLERTIARASAGPDPRPGPIHRHTISTTSSSTMTIPTVPPDEILSPQPKSSVQKILKLTGNMSPTTILSTDSPSLHNSKEKIRQLTGLDVGPQRRKESMLEESDEESGSTSSPKAQHETYILSMPQSTSNAPAESVYSSSDADSVKEDLITPLSAPRYVASPPHPPNSFLRVESFPSPVTEAPRSSGFATAESGVTTPGNTTPTAARREPACHAHTEEEYHSSSSSEISDAEFELEPTAGELYHDTAVAIARSSTNIPSISAGDKSSLSSPPSKLQKMGWDSSCEFDDTFPPPRSCGSTRGSIGSIIESTQSDSASASSRTFSRNPFRSREHNSLSERRGHILLPLDNALAGGVSYSARRKQSQPHPPVSGSIRATIEEAAGAEDSQARLSLLARLFTSGGCSIVAKRDSAASESSRSGGGGGRTVSVTSSSLSGPPTMSSAWSPDTPSPSNAGTFGGDVARHSAGLLARARNATGSNSKAEKARASLRGKIKVLRNDESDAGSSKGVDKLT